MSVLMVCCNTRYANVTDSMNHECNTEIIHTNATSAPIIADIFPVEISFIATRTSYTKDRRGDWHTNYTK